MCQIVDKCYNNTQAWPVQTLTFVVEHHPSEKSKGFSAVIGRTRGTRVAQ